MAQVSLPPDGPYARRVSFNNLHPDDLETGTSKFYLYSMSQPSSTSHTSELDVGKMFGNYSLGNIISTTTRKRVKLPDPPSKLILKNKLTPAQLSQNLQHAMLLGVSYHGDINDMVQHPPESVPRLELARVEVDDPPDESDLEDELLPPPPPSGRRKLYSMMTDEELMALDPQFAKPRTSSIDNFKFDLLTTYYSNNTRRGSTTAHVAQPLSKHVVYPLLNENNYKSISLTVRHQDYETDTEASRTLLTVISGRKHTWNSLDWLLVTDPELKGTPTFLQHGDYLVIAALVPLKFMDGVTDAKKQQSVDDKLYKQCDRLLKYVLDKLPDKQLRLKITIEFVLDVPPLDPLSPNYKKNLPTGAKFMLTHLFKQYHPTLVIVGNKSTNLNFKYPIRKKRQHSAVTPPQPALAGLVKMQLVPASTEQVVEAYLIKLSSFLIKYSTVPLILVGNSTIFHRKPEVKQSTAVTFSDAKPPSKSILDVPPESHRKNSTGSDCSIESFTGHESDMLLESPEELRENLDDLSASHSETRFAEMLASITLYSLAHLRKYLNIVNDDTIERLSPEILNSKVHQVYQSIGSGRSLSQSQSNGAAGKAYKVKSLILYSEEEEKKNEKMINDKRLKKTVSRGLLTSLKSADDKKPKKKKSFFQKLGMKK